MVLETFEVSIDTSQHASLCPLKAFPGLDTRRENLKGLKQVLLGICPISLTRHCHPRREIDSQRPSATAPHTSGVPARGARAATTTPPGASWTTCRAGILWPKSTFGDDPQASRPSAAAPTPPATSAVCETIIGRRAQLRCFTSLWTQGPNWPPNPSSSPFAPPWSSPASLPTTSPVRTPSHPSLPHSPQGLRKRGSTPLGGRGRSPWPRMSHRGQRPSSCERAGAHFCRPAMRLS